MINLKFNSTSLLKSLAISFLIFIFFISFSTKSLAATGIYEVINFQGKVVNKTAGTNVTNGNYDFTFRIYDAASGGTLIWTENFNTTNGNQLTVTDGIFRTALGSVCAFTGGSCQGNTNTAVNFNSDNLYLDISFNGETFGSRVRLTAVPYALNAKQVNGLSVTNNGGNTLNIAANKTFTVSNSLTFTGTDSTSFAFPTTSDGTVLTSNASSQGITSTQTSGTVLSLADSTGLAGSLTGLNVSLTSSTNSQNKTGLSFDLSGGTGGTYYDLLGTGSTWSITRAGDLTVASCTGCGGASGSNYWNLVSGNGAANGGYVTPINSTADFLLGAQATTSAKFSVLNLNPNANLTPVASISAQDNPLFRALSLSGDGTIQSVRNNTLTIGGDTTGDIYFKPGNISTGLYLTSQGFVGIGNQTPTNKLDIIETKTDTSGFWQMVYNRLTANPAGVSTATYISNFNEARTNSGSAIDFSGSSLVGLYNLSVHRGTNTLGNAYGVQGLVKTDNSGTITNAYPFYASGQMTTAAGTIDTFAAYYASEPTIAGGGTINNTYGLYVTAYDIGGSDYGARIDAAQTQTLWLAGNTDTTDATTGIAFGQSRDTNLYRTTTNTLKTDDAFQAGGLITALAGLTVTAGQSLTVNNEAIQDLTGNGLVLSANALSINLTSSGNTGSNSSNSGLEVGASGLTLLKGCNDGELLEYTDASGWACAVDNTGGGSGGSSNWTQNSGLGIIKPNNDTLDILFGGTSTSSAKFAFMNMDSNSGLDPLASFSGNLMIEARPANSSVTEQTTWTRISQATAGQVMSSGTTLISSISAMAVYNGSLYVGTYKNGAGEAEVYRYKGTGSDWEKVSHATAGTIGGAGTPTSGIASVSAMTVFDGRLYIGTSKMNAAEIYRYDGGTTWVKVSHGTAGTIGNSASPTANIDGVSSMAVYQGTLFAGTREHTTTAGTAELYKYSTLAGAAAWQEVNTTAGTFVATNTVGVWAVTNMVVKNGYLYLGVLKPGDADVLRYQGGAGNVFLSMNLASLTGSYLIDGTAATAFNEVASMAVYNGSLVVGLNKLNSAEVLMLQDGGGTQTVPNSWRRLNNAIGQMTNGGTSSIDGISSMAVYNGSLYIGTLENGNAEIYRYTGGSQKFMELTIGLSNGQFVSGGRSEIDAVTRMIQANGDLVMSTMELGAAEIYKQTIKPIDSSYALQFHAKPTIAGGEQNSMESYASIFFMASASANLGSNAGNTGAFFFSHGIQTRSGNYDVAEDYPTRDDTLEPGDLIAIDTSERGFVKKSETAGDLGVIGVYSKSPALRLSQEDAHIDGAKVVPVALAGRVPVKVSTENGKIKSGDYLTASSIPGVAMKATRAGNVVGQAMGGYEDSGVGSVVVYVRSNSYSGTTASLFDGIDSNSVNFEQEILSKLLAKDKSGLVSEINTDRIIAGLEIITPKIVADEIIVKRIKAESIEGLEIITGRLSVMDLNFASLSAIFANSSIEVGTREATIANQNLSGNLVLASLDVNGIATISADLRVKGSGLVEGIFSVVDTLVTNNLIVNGVTNFFAQVIFKDDVIFEGTPTFNSDTGGLATIKKDSNKVEIVFEKEYEKAPVISANIAFEQKKNDDGSVKDSKDLEVKVFEKNYSFVVVNRSEKGFNIVLNKKAEDDIEFSWIALAISEKKISFSKEVIDFVQQVLSPTPSILNPQAASESSH